MSQTQNDSFKLLHIGIGLASALCMLVWLKWAPPYFQEEAKTTESESSVKQNESGSEMEKLRQQLVVEKEKVKEFEVIITNYESQIINLKSELNNNEVTVEDLEKIIMGKDSEIRNIKNNYQLRLEDLSHLMMAVKLHRTIDQTVINRVQLVLEKEE